MAGMEQESDFDSDSAFADSHSSPSLKRTDTHPDFDSDSDCGSDFALHTPASRKDHHCYSYWHWPCYCLSPDTDLRSYHTHRYAEVVVHAAAALERPSSVGVQMAEVTVSSGADAVVADDNVAEAVVGVGVAAAAEREIDDLKEEEGVPMLVDAVVHAAAEMVGEENANDVGVKQGVAVVDSGARRSGWDAVAAADEPVGDSWPAAVHDAEDALDDEELVKFNGTAKDLVLELELKDDPDPEPDPGTDADPLDETTPYPPEPPPPNAEPEEVLLPFGSDEEDGVYYATTVLCSTTKVAGNGTKTVKNMNVTADHALKMWKTRKRVVVGHKSLKRKMMLDGVMKKRNNASYFQMELAQLWYLGKCLKEEVEVTIAAEVHNSSLEVAEAVVHCSHSHMKVKQKKKQAEVVGANAEQAVEEGNVTTNEIENASSRWMRPKTERVVVRERANSAVVDDGRTGHMPTKVAAVIHEMKMKKWVVNAADGASERNCCCSPEAGVDGVVQEEDKLSIDRRQRCPHSTRHGRASNDRRRTSLVLIAFSRSCLDVRTRLLNAGKAGDTPSDLRTVGTVVRKGMNIRRGGDGDGQRRRPKS
ncbi:hypothetical protein CPB84DRAFT_1746197 [Gymnopilus junonius]|uniref:Uncharacterized protein n=1 Tax=Gymnopilus junonius TaxID=109634 RepID=A0A9P5TQG2_GYMJU|nr:hypothetical protein CPB84DRAFT_1746197 [Gymnopilus junonius]